MCVYVCDPREKSLLPLAVGIAVTSYIVALECWDIPERRGKEEREREEGENGKDLGFWLEISESTRGGTKKGTGRLAGEKDKWYSSRSRSSSSSVRRRPDTDGPTPKDRDVWMFERRSAVSALELPSILPVSLLTCPLLLFECPDLARYQGSTGWPESFSDTF